MSIASSDQTGECFKPIACKSFFIFLE